LPPFPYTTLFRSSGPSPGLVASLRGLGAAVTGKVRVIDRGDGITLLISAINMPIGEYRVAFHQNGNCSSPNGFSAGPAWAPSGQSPATLIPPLTNSDGNAEASVWVSGVHTAGENGVAGRRGLLYGRKVEERRAEWGALDGLLHSIAFAPRESLSGDFLNGMNRAAFAMAHDVSSYSFAALAKAARPLLAGRNASLLTLTYLGAARAIANYNLMGL